MSGPYLLALDQGTTSSRAILFDREGHMRGVAQREFRQIFPQPGWVEHDAEEIWQTQLEVMRQALREQGVQASELAAIGITNQRETTVIWDRRSGKPIANAIVWQDRRTAGMCDELRTAGKTDLVRQKTGLVIDAYFSGTKLRWLLDNIPGARAAADRGELAFGTIDSWLIYKLTGAQGTHLTDASNASRTMLFDIHSGRWCEELLALLDVPASMLPQVTPSSGVVAHASEEWLGAPVPIAGIAGDQQAATFGQACCRPGMAKNTYGTGCFMLLNTGTRAIESKNNLLTTIGWTMRDKTSVHTDYMLEGSVFMAGATVQWLRDGLGIIEKSSDVETLALSVPDNGGVSFVPAFAGLGAPYWDAYARGTIIGLTRGSTKAHIARAALESIAYQSAEVLQAMQKDSDIALEELRVDGGAARNDLLMQFQADVLGVPVVRPAVTETTALGAAYLAGLATGVWSSKEEIASLWKEDKRFEPRMTADEREQRLRIWRTAVERARRWEQPAG